MRSSVKVCSKCVVDGFEKKRQAESLENRRSKIEWKLIKKNL